MEHKVLSSLYLLYYHYKKLSSTVLNVELVTLMNSAFDTNNICDSFTHPCYNFSLLVLIDFPPEKKTFVLN